MEPGGSWQSQACATVVDMVHEMTPGRRLAKAKLDVADARAELRRWAHEMEHLPPGNLRNTIATREAALRAVLAEKQGLLVQLQDELSRVRGSGHRS